MTVTGLLMVPVLAAALAGLALDARAITGAPAWLKPAKFAASIGIYSLTLAWVLTFLPEWRRTRGIVGWTTAAALVLEMLVIAAQAFRGVASHFNVGTPLDAALFGVMGAAIVVQTLSTIAVAVALWRHRFEDRAMGWALRAGMTITIVGALSGGLMTAPTSHQLEAARAGGRMTVVGAHTVGAPDGGPGLPATGWSTTHGDLRVAHFIGLHALQALPLLVAALRRVRVNGAPRVRLAVVASVSYAALFGVFLWQALRGQSVLAPDGLTVAVLVVWAAGTAVAAGAAALDREPAHRPVVV